MRKVHPKGGAKSMTTDQEYFDSLLDRVHNVPVKTHRDGPIPTNAIYGPVRSIVQNGISFSPRELIHAIGCKMINLPAHREDEGLSFALAYTEALDLESPYLVYKKGIGYGSDFQTLYSMGIGVGMTCLVASKCLGVPFDQLEPIPGRGTRFDYRGQSRNLKCIFESKGTSHKGNQSSQVKNGIDKKAILKKRRARFDIGLVISTFVGMKPEAPRLLIADPEYEGIAFRNDNEKYYRLRHFARVMQFIGATPLARELYVESNDILWGRPSMAFFPREVDRYPVREMPEIKIDESLFVGRWNETWLPIKSFRYKGLRSITLPKLLDSRPKAKVSVFQGLSKKNFEAIRGRALEDIIITKGEKLVTTTRTGEGEMASVFPDGTVLIFKVHS